MAEIAKVRYPHEAIIEEIILHPMITQRELARRCGRSEYWMSCIVNSDAFKQRLEERKEELVDPIIRASVEQRLQAVAEMALDRLVDKLEGPGPHKIIDLVAAAKLGVGDRNMVNSKPAVQNNLYVVHLPAPDKTTVGWLENAQGRKPAEVIDISHSNPEP